MSRLGRLLLIFVLLRNDLLQHVIRYFKEARLLKSSFHCCVVLVRSGFGFVGKESLSSVDSNPYHNTRYLFEN